MLLLLLIASVCVSMNNADAAASSHFKHTAKYQCVAKKIFDYYGNACPNIMLKRRARNLEKNHYFQWQPIKEGYQRRINFGNHQNISLVTLSTKPKLFLMDNFLSEKECEEMISRAKSHKMCESEIYKLQAVVHTVNENFRKSLEAMKKFGTWDVNGDTLISIDEIIETCRKNMHLYIGKVEVDAMFIYKKWSEMDDDVITVPEFQLMNLTELHSYLHDLRHYHPRFRERFSDTTWLLKNDSSDWLMNSLKSRVLTVTRLSERIWNNSETIGVTSYQQYGHYHAHHDTNHLPCDEKTQELNSEEDGDYPLCRFVTILVYLNDVEKGGETAFPVGGQDSNRTSFSSEDLNLTNFCHNASLIVKPRKGRALLWYNYILKDDGKIDKLDSSSLHGGCDVIKGEKWVSNIWLKITE